MFGRKIFVLLFGFLANRHWKEIDCSLFVCLHLNDCTINTTKTNIKKFSSWKPIWKSRNDCNPKENLVSNKFSMKNRLSWWLQPFVGPLNHIEFMIFLPKASIFLLLLDFGFAFLWTFSSFTPSAIVSDSFKSLDIP